MLYKFCRCGKQIEYTEGRCSVCKAQEEEQAKARYSKYRNKRTKDKESEFYNTKEWKQKREYILNKYLNMSIYSYYKYGRIDVGDTIHHIVEVREDWSKRLDSFNMIPLTAKEHQEIHLRMDIEGSEVVRRELLGMLEKFREEFGVSLV